MKYVGRRKPYTERGISRIRCYRCGRPSSQQWQVCANGNRFLGVCNECDIRMNEMVLEFMKFPEHIACALMRKYREELER